MKKIMLFATLLLMVTSINAQDFDMPAMSPFQEIKQKVGISSIKVEYSRPSLRGRKVFGDLVPYDKMWRTGANANTKITFSKNVIIDGKEVKAGIYALYTKPHTDSWDIYLYADSKNWGLPSTWEDNKVVFTTNAKVQMKPNATELFTISFDGISNNEEALLHMVWDKTEVTLPIKVNTKKLMAKQVNKILAGPSANDYYLVVNYYLQTGDNMQQCKVWMEKAVAMSADYKYLFTYIHTKANVHAALGEKNQAIAAAKKSLVLAEKAGSKVYVSENKKLLKNLGVSM